MPTPLRPGPFGQSISIRAVGFDPTTSRIRTECATRLRYTLWLRPGCLVPATLVEALPSRTAPLYTHYMVVGHYAHDT